MNENPGIELTLSLLDENIKNLHRLRDANMWMGPAGLDFQTQDKYRQSIERLFQEYAVCSDLLAEALIKGQRSWPKFDQELEEKTYRYYENEYGARKHLITGEWPDLSSKTTKNSHEISYRRKTLVDVLVQHQPTNTSGCICGWAVLGASHPEHVADIYQAQTHE